MTAARSSRAKSGRGDGGRAPIPVEAVLSADAVIEESAKLEDLIRREAAERGTWDELGDHAARAETLMLTAAQTGAVTWDSAQRGDLRRVILRWGTALKRGGHNVSIPDLAPFSDQLPGLDDASGEHAVELARNGEPIVGLKIKGADLRALSGIGSVKIFDCGLYGCNLMGVELDRSRLIHTIFADCNFDGARLSRAVATSCTFGGGSFRVHAPNATFNGSRFDGVMLTGGGFQKCSFGAATLLRLDASDANFFDALFDFADVEEVTFDQAKLGRALFVGGTVRGCAFKGADLKEAIFSSTTVQGSDFCGAQLANTSFAKARDVTTATFDPDAATHARFSEHDAARLRAASSQGG